MQDDQRKGDHEDVTGPSLLEVLEEQLQNPDRPRGSFTRTFYAAKLADANNLGEVKTMIKGIFREIGTAFPGLVFIQEDSALVYLESSSEEAIAFLKSLNTRDLMHSVRIIASCDDMPEQLLHSFYIRKIALGKAAELEIDDTNYAKVSYDVYAKFQEFIKVLSELPEDQVNKSLDNVSKLYKDYIPSNHDILAYTECEFIPDIKLFLELFDEPLSTALESDKIFPIVPLISY